MKKTALPVALRVLASIPNARIEAGLKLLRNAWEMARAVNRDLWEFAIEIGELHAAGLTGADLRWLLCLGYAQHATEEITDGNVTRIFHHLPNLSLPGRTCFILTSKGLQTFAGQLDDTPATPGPSQLLEGGSPPCLFVVKPCWDAALRRLTWKGQPVKEFRIPAENQEALLAQFEKEGWPLRIEDPLQRVEGLDRKARLHDSIKALNRNQVNRLVRFQGDGTTRGVLWSPIE